MVPRQGPINGIQKRTTTTSGFMFLTWLPTLIQFNGFTEFMAEIILIPFGAGASVNWEEPGKRKDGY